MFSQADYSPSLGISFFLPSGGHLRPEIVSRGQFHEDRPVNAILLIVHRSRRRYRRPKGQGAGDMSQESGVRRSVDENGDESGLRVENLLIVHRSRRRYRRPKGQGAGDRLTRTATRTDNEWRESQSSPALVGRYRSPKSHCPSIDPRPPPGLFLDLRKYDFRARTNSLILTSLWQCSTILRSPRLPMFWAERSCLPELECPFRRFSIISTTVSRWPSF